MVPSWVTAVKAAPGSSQPRKAGTIRRWPVLEIGRNSVSPCTIPRTIASSVLMRGARDYEREGTANRSTRGDGRRRPRADTRVLGPHDGGRRDDAGGIVRAASAVDLHLPRRAGEQ